MKRSTFLRVTSLSGLGMGLGGLVMVERASGQTPPVASTLRPYLHLLRTDSVWVSWWSDGGGQTVVEWGDSADSLTQTATGSATADGAANFYHLVQITGLQAGRFYHYRVRSGTETSAVFRFRTPPPAGTKTGRFRVLVLGDNQILTGERRWERMMERARAHIEQTHGKPIEEVVDFILTAGDQVDVGTVNHWRNLHFAYSKSLSPLLSTMTTVGNHETYQDNGLARYRSLFRYEQALYQNLASPDPKVAFAYQYANILFIHLSSEHTGAPQAAWVQSVISAAAADASVDFIISLCHRPYQAEQFVGDISTWLRNTVMPILCQTPKHVLNIGAHHHLYSRGQTRQWPCYHIISGASAWDQFWGQSTETDFDDVQKTIANWAWQLLDFDLDVGKLEVSCFAEANVKFPETTRWTTQAYQSRLIDQFSRQPSLPPPATPTIINAQTAPVTLPFALRSGPFSSPAGQVLNSAWFQIAKDPTFTNLIVDRIRDVENLYGDTGAPLWEPVNRHAGVDILEWPIALGGLPNGTYHARVRHRDANVSWSNWSPTISFTVQGSTAGAPAIRLAKSVFNNATSENVAVQFEFAPGNTRDWIGIYQKGQTPGSSTASTLWNYLNGTRTAPTTPIANGSLNFPSASLTAGNREWYAAFFSNDSYTEVAPRVPFFVGTTPSLTPSKETYNVGETVRINFATAPATSTAPRNVDWIGIYRVGQIPGAVGSVQWSYVTSASGFRDFANLAKGYYYATYMVNDGYFEISPIALFSVGTEISSCAMPRTALAHGEDFDVNFSDGPGTPKDYIGIFRQGEEPGEGDLIAYLYVGGLSAGAVRFVEDIAPGDYYAALFINDSYTAVSPRVNFTVAAAPDHSLRDLSVDGESIRMAFSSEAGKSYRLWKNPSLAPSEWIPVRTIMGTGARMEISEVLDPTLDRCFFRLERLD
jgi:hypothetical protein